MPGHSVSKYHAWMKNFVPFIQWPLAIFCDEQSLDMLKRLRGEKPAVYFVTDLEEFFVRKYRDVFRAQCDGTDWPYPTIYPEYAMVWNEKSHFLQRAIESNPFASDMFFWCDIGFFRSRSGKGIRLSERLEWPNLRVCRTAFRNKAAFFTRTPRAFRPPAHDRLLRYDLSPEVHWIGGGFFGGAVDAVLRCCETFYQCLEQRIELGYYAGSDELTLSDVYSLRSDIVRLITPKELAWGLRESSHDRECFHWYCLSGDKLPWQYICREIPFYLRNFDAPKRVLRRMMPRFSRR